ncbi:SOMATIC EMBRYOGENESIS RECEPTOR KINASE 1 [Salix viminalis]|uniref:SOMATIC EMBRYOGENESIS RECEPTOR KINASE 1 n=1 Tax=Salix viminalis TaxID=40686 RepID=A0A9Q0QJA5_SALVM|nr:SOMATIC EMBRYOGENESIS RECEPTOR KINASE 1 [Salix viminalis]
MDFWLVKQEVLAHFMTSMAKRIREVGFTFVVFLWFSSAANGLLSPKGINYEVQALMGIKASLHDPHGVLDNWDGDAVDPCSWTMVTCSPESLVVGLGIPSQNLSGTLSPTIGNLTNLQTVLLQSNNITGPIPAEIARLSKLHTLDLSDNFFTGKIPSSLGYLRSLEYMRLNNNSLSGEFPLSLANMTQLVLLDLSFNNLSGPVPRFPTKTFSIAGNPLICPTGSEPECFGTILIPMSMNLNRTQTLPSDKPKSHKIAVAFGLSVGSVSLFILVFGLFLWWRQRHNQPTFFDVKDRQHEEVTLGNLRRFQFRELQISTNNFSNKNILGKGGFGNVYKGILHDGTVVAVKRLKDGNAIGGEIQFQTEVEMISLAVHRNLLRLYGFLYYTNRKTSSLSIHVQWQRSFASKRQTNHQDSHVTTAVRGTVGHIAPEYLSTGQSSEKTDVFGFGILLLELITGQRALEFGKAANQKGAMLEWVRKIHQEKKLEMFVDKDIKGNYDRIELEEMVQVALLSTQYLPSHRP